MSDIEFLLIILSILSLFALFMWFLTMNYKQSEDMVARRKREKI
jgi:hypothetical protein